jgi:hypothetical protein
MQPIYINLTKSGQNTINENQFINIKKASLGDIRTSMGIKDNRQTCNPISARIVEK